MTLPEGPVTSPPNEAEQAANRAEAEAHGTKVDTFIRMVRSLRRYAGPPALPEGHTGQWVWNGHRWVVEEVHEDHGSA